MKFFLYFVGGIFILGNISCSESNKNPDHIISDKNNKKDSTTINLAVKDENGVIIPTVSGIIELTPKEGKIKATIHKEKDQIIYIKFPSENDTKLSAHITSKDVKANLHISQIILPNGKMDGPFGSDISYTLLQKGTYGLLIHENKMAGDSWKGNFTIEIDLSK